MADIMIDAIAMTNGPCEGPHEIPSVPDAVKVVGFYVRSYCGSTECEEQREMIASLRLCQGCIDRIEAARWKARLTMQLNGRISGLPYNGTERSILSFEGGS